MGIMLLTIVFLIFLGIFVGRTSTAIRNKRNSYEHPESGEVIGFLIGGVLFGIFFFFFNPSVQEFMGNDDDAIPVFIWFCMATGAFSGLVIGYIRNISETLGFFIGYEMCFLLAGVAFNIMSGFYLVEAHGGFDDWEGIGRNGFTDFTVIGGRIADGICFGVGLAIATRHSLVANNTISRADSWKFVLYMSIGMIVGGVIGYFVIGEIAKEFSNEPIGGFIGIIGGIIIRIIIYTIVYRHLVKTKLDSINLTELSKKRYIFILVLVSVGIGFPFLSDSNDSVQTNSNNTNNRDNQGHSYTQENHEFEFESNDNQVLTDASNSTFSYTPTPQPFHGHSRSTYETSFEAGIRYSGFVRGKTIDFDKSIKGFSLEFTSSKSVTTSIEIYQDIEFNVFVYDDNQKKWIHVESFVFDTLNARTTLEIYYPNMSISSVNVTVADSNNSGMWNFAHQSILISDLIIR